MATSDYSTALHGTVTAAAITPSDTVDLVGGATRSIYVGVTGDLKVDLVGGTTVTYGNVPVGRLAIHATRVYAIAGVATELLAEY